jgi:hypothetical protein
LDKTAGPRTHEILSELDAMLKTKTLIVAAAVAALASTSVFAQECTSCNSFGYPSQSGYDTYGNPQTGTRKLDHWKSINHKVMARNDAWPKPFDCADRQVYFSIWNPMIENGFEEQCILMAAHFDPKTNELNRFGLHTVAGIMQNMPSTHKHVFVNQDTDTNVTQARLRSVEKIVDTFYGSIAPNAKVAVSSKLPSSIRGIRAETINTLFIDGAPSPIIPISSGSDSVSQSINN